MAGGLTFKMADQVKSVREVTVFSDNPRPRTLDFTIGASAPTTIRDEETLKFNIGGGYGYKDSSRAYSSTSNRFIYWKINENILELLEESLDVNLFGNNLKIRFTDGMLLPGLSIFETPTNVCVLVATTNSVHRIAFPHPHKSHSHAFGLSSSSDQNLSSIFNTSSVTELREPWNFATFSSNCISSSAWLCQDGHTLFALATSIGSILLVKLPPVGVHEEAEQFELQQSSMIQRLWSGLVPSSLRGDSPFPDGVVDLQIQPLGKQMCIFTLCRDHKLRIWSCQKQECISVKDLLEDIPDDIDGQTVTAHNHMLRMTVDPTTGRIYVGAFLSFQYQNQFCVYEAVADDQSVSLSPVSNLYSAVGRLVDFTLSSAEIWTQWISNDGESVTYFTSIENGQQNDSGWHKVLGQSSISLSILVPPHMEPREVYLEELFYPGRFSNQVIIKALQIYQHGSNLGHNMSALLSDRNELKKRVINLIDTEIQLSAPSNELMYSEYYDLQLSCWEKFYSCVVQYHEVGHQPLGLFIDTKTGIVGLVRKEMLSILRPCDGVEKLYSQTMDQENFTAMPFLITDKSMRKDLTTVCNALRLVSQQLTQENKAAIQNDLTYQCDPSLTAKQISESLITNPVDDTENSAQHTFHSEFTQEIETSLQKVSNLCECFKVVLRSLDLSGIPLDDNEDPGWMGDKIGSCPKLGSQLMRQLLAHCFQQTMETRLSLCRDFLVLLGVIERLSSKTGLNPHFSQDISSLYIPQTVLLLRVYHCLHWSTKLLVMPAPSNAVESNLKQLAALEISDGLQAKQVEDHPNTTVLQLFLSTTGGAQLSQLMSKLQQTNKSVGGYKKVNPLGVMINQAVYTLTGLLWPSEAATIFPEFLLTNYQYMHLQDYCQLLDSWCDDRQSYRLFLCGQSYLVLGENFKALDCFLHAAEGASMDDRLIGKVLQADVLDETSLKVLFYVKVMRLFEQFDAPDLVIFIANTAISIASPDDPNIPNLWSNIFKHHLHLGHNDEAYAALTSNPDPSRKRDCLHRFMVVLCERGQLQELCEYPYVNLHDEFVDIMESHARTVDIATHQYYDLLYAFHVFRGNYRKAGSVMYEYGGRLGRELPGKQGLQKQAKCYLAALNALRLVDPKNAWIVTPWDRAQKKKNDEPPNSSPKRKQGDEDSWYGIDRHSRARRKLTVMEIHDLEKEYLLVLARLQLLRVEADPSEATGPPLTAQETLTLLTQAGLFDTAFTVASGFNLSRDTIFEGLAARCVRQSYNLGMTRSGGIEDNEAWDWLLENDTGNTQPARDKSVADQAWKLLQCYLDKLRDTENGRCYYRCVASKLLSIGAPIPTWLINDYKRLNPAELLYLYVTYDMLQEAADLAIEYINAVLGEGKEYFGLKTALHATMPSVWLPYTTLDHLLAALESAPADSNLAEIKEELLDRLDRYHEQVERVSEDMTTAAWKRAQRRNAAESLPWQ